VNALPRLVPDEPLPPYSYVSGQHPHPMRDPAGHSFGKPHEPPAAIDPENWRSSRTYLVGCDLFNHGYYWEAHETWEGLWNACGRRGTAADFLKGLIKLAAAGVKIREGRVEGMRRHGARAAELFRQVDSATSEPDFLGLDLDELIQFAEEITMAALPEVTASDGVPIVVELRLLPVG